MLVVSSIKIDLTRKDFQQYIYATQDDSGSRAVEIQLYTGKAPWNVPADVTGAISYKKADKNSGLYDTMPDGTSAVSIEGNKVLARLAPQVLNVPGDVNFSVALYDAKMQRLNTFPCVIKVEKNPSAVVTESEDYYWISVLGAVGDLDQLLTEDKTSLVGAVNEVASTKPDYAVNDPTRLDFIKNRPFYTEDVPSKGPAFTNQLTFSSADVSGQVSLDSTAQLRKEQTYFVVFDGVDYPCVAATTDDGVALGNASLKYSDMPDTGEPFYAFYTYRGRHVVVVQCLPGDHTVQLCYGNPESIKTIEDKYLSSHIARTMRRVTSFVTTYAVSSIHISGLDVEPPVSIRIFNTGESVGAGLILTVNDISDSVSGGSGTAATTGTDLARIRAWLWEEDGVLVGKSIMVNDAINNYRFGVAMPRINSINIRPAYSSSGMYQAGTVVEIYEGVFPNVK